VTRVYPYSAEVTLLTDKEAAIPVLNARTQARSAAYGNSAGAGLELRFMAGNADVQVGDLLSTSGVDGIYPAGVPVAKVVSVDRRVDTGFARIALAPLAEPDSVRHVLVLEPTGIQMPPRPEPETEGVVGKPAKKGARK
jgi:rod shape-determining protein MreC